MKKYFLLLFISVLTAYSYGQTSRFRLQKTLNSPFGSPQDITIDPEGYIYIMDNGNVIKLDSSGNRLSSFQMILKGEPVVAMEFTTDREGSFFMLGYSQPYIQKFSNNGQPLLQFGTYGSEIGQIKSPGDIAVDISGNIYVSDTENHTIHKYNKLGEYLTQFGSMGSANGMFMYPKGITTDNEGNLYVIDGGNQRIQKFNTSGQFLSKFDVKSQNQWQQRYMESIVVGADGSIYISENVQNIITKFNNKGVFQLQIGETTPMDAGYFQGTKISLALDASGNLYAADKRHLYDSYIHKFNNSGLSLSRIGSWSKEDGKFHNPHGVAVDVMENFYIADVDNSRIQKFDMSGQFISKFISIDNAEGRLVNWGYVSDIAVDISGNVYVLENHLDYPKVLKYEPNGKFIREYENFGSESGNRYTGIAVDFAGNIYLSEYHSGCILKINANGQSFTKIGTLGKQGNGQLFAPQGVAVDKKGNIYALDSNGHRIQKFNSKGEFLLQQGNFEDSLAIKANIQVDDNGFLYVASVMDGFIQVYDSLLLPVERVQISAHKIGVSRNGKNLVSLEYNQHSVHIYSSENTISPTKQCYISGSIYQDINKNCLKDSQEKGIPGIVVAAEPGPFYGVSDELGNYLIQVDTGTYTIHQIIPELYSRKIVQTCPSGSSVHTVSLNLHTNISSGKNFANQVLEFPSLSASLSSDRRRRCFTNATTVSYSNSGFAQATNVKVYVQMPEYVIFQSADKSYTRDASGNYVFDIGTLAPYQTGTIVIQDSVVCNDSSIRGLTQCTKAWIVPTNSYSGSEKWDQSDMAVEAKCLDNGVVRFALKNTGQGNMADSLQLRIFLDAQLALSYQFKLIKGDSLILRVPVNGRTVRLEADQNSYHPVKKMAHATLEGCGVNAEGKVSIGYVNLFPTDDAQTEVSIDCQPIIDSFDPNDKGVTPEGLTEEKFTPTNTDLHYLIRFQNTGTDVAYRVVVVDTLSTKLDLATFQMGAASHNYKLSVSGKGRPILTWTFNNINLPDSTTDQLGSNGFLSFSIKPKAELPEKEKIENFADIFFDYNEPVRTNTVINRIYDMPYLLSGLQLNPENIITIPELKSFSPLEGRFGTKVTLHGKNFASTTKHNIVRFNGMLTPVIQANTESITVEVPVGATTGKISIQTPDGLKQSTTDFIIFQLPVITDFSPKEIKATEKTILTITGKHFSTDPTKDTVTIDGLVVKILSATDTKLIVEIPEQARSGKLWLAALGGSTYSSQELIVWHSPLISIISTDTAKVGSILKITGENFASSSERNIVKFGENLGLIKGASPLELQVQIPVGAQTSYVRIETPGGMALSKHLLVIIPQPLITDFTPKQGPISTKVTIHGKHFNAFSTQDMVYVNNVLATISYQTDTTLLISIPKDAQSGKISVFGLGGHSISTDDFVVEKLSLQESVSVYPNPSNGTFLIDFSKATFYANTVKLYNALGLLVYEKSFASPHPDNISLELSSYVKGMYLMTLNTESGTIIKKVVLN